MSSFQLDKNNLIEINTPIINKEITDSEISSSNINTPRETSYSMLSFSNGMQWVTFSPIGDSFKKNYNLNTFQLDLFSLIYMITFPIVNFPSSYIIDRKSVRLGIVLSSILTVIGSGLKCFINNRILYAYIGQILSGVAQPFILNSPGKIASTWFRQERRVTATTICCLTNTLGLIFGYLFPLFFFRESMNLNEYKQQIDQYLFWSFILNAAFCLPAIFLFKSKPAIPPSYSQYNYVSPPLLKSIKMMIANKNFIVFLVSFTSVLNYFCLYGTIINEYFSKYGLTEKQTSVVIVSGYSFSIFSSLLVSIKINKSRNYRSVFIILNIVGLICHSLMVLLIEFTKDYSFYVILFLWTICSCSILPIYTCGIDLVGEITYPVGESISGGMINSFQQITCVLIILMTGFMIDNMTRIMPNIIALSLFVFSLISTFMLEEKLLKVENDNRISLKKITNS